MVIFGAAGDLTKRLVVPALYNLANARQLVRQISSSSASTWPPRPREQWRQGLTDIDERIRHQGGEFHADHIDQAAWRWLTEPMSYLQGDLNDPGTYHRLGEHLADLDKTPARPAIICSISRSPTASSARGRRPWRRRA